MARYLLHILVYESEEQLLRSGSDSLMERVTELKAQNKLIEHTKDVTINQTKLNDIFGLVHNGLTQYKEQFRDKLTYPHLYVSITGEPV